MAATAAASSERHGSSPSSFAFGPSGTSSTKSASETRWSLSVATSPQYAVSACQLTAIRGARTAYLVAGTQSGAVGKTHHEKRRTIQSAGHIPAIRYRLDERRFKRT